MQRLILKPFNARRLSGIPGRMPKKKGSKVVLSTMFFIERETWSMMSGEQKADVLWSALKQDLRMHDDRSRGQIVFEKRDHGEDD
jgi:hypothetical protein